jgi:hypothetical protein
LVVLFLAIILSDGIPKNKSDLETNKEIGDNLEFTHSSYLEDKGYEVLSVEEVIYEGDIWNTVQVEMIKSFEAKPYRLEMECIILIQFIEGMMGL